MIADVLARIEEGAARVLAGRAAPGLSRELAALGRADPLQITAEVATPAEIELAVQLGADAIRIDADDLLAPLCDLVRACLVVFDVHARRLLLDELRATIASAAAPFVALGALDITVAVGTRAARSQFPRSAERAVAAAIRAGLEPPRAAAAIEAMTARAGRLGVRGARWIADDPELFAAIVGGWADAAADRGMRRLAFVAPAIGFAGELVPVRRLIDRIAAEVAADAAPIAIRIGAGIETVRGVLVLDTIERAADFAELDLEALTETCLALSVDDAPRCMPQMLAAGVFGFDPFGDLDPAIAALLTAAYQEGRTRTARGALVLGSHALARLDDFAIAGLTVPVRDAARARIARARRVVHPSSRARATRLAGLAAASPTVLPAGPPPLPSGIRARVVLDELVGEVERGALAIEAALGRIPPAIVDALARPVLDDTGREPLAVGIGVAPGAGVGRIALSAARAGELVRDGEPVILVVREVYGDEAAILPATRGLVSTRGGRTSHAALVAANCGVPCVIAEHIVLSPTSVAIGGRVLVEGAWLSIDGSTGALHGDRVPLVAGASEASFATLMRWSDGVRRLRVLANADTADAIRAALAAGAEGIGLVRTENMFLDPAHLGALQALLLRDADERDLETLQRSGFAVRLAAAAGAPITFRLLDASLYELLPHDRAGVESLAAKLGMSVDDVARRVDAERPTEPSMSLRASRLALSRPAIERAQVRALAAAWLAATKPAPLRILVPMVVSGGEMAAIAARIRAYAAEIASEHGAPPIPLVLGAMIETPRAALDAAAIARSVDFFAWGSNDLTQYAIGLARAAFPLVIPRLQACRALDLDPSETIDLGGVGVLVHLAENLARAVHPSLVTGVCGNLAADARSIRAFHALGLGYISVPPSQISSARLAAAQAALG